MIVDAEIHQSHIVQGRNTLMYRRLPGSLKQWDSSYHMIRMGWLYDSYDMIHMGWYMATYKTACQGDRAMAVLQAVGLAPLSNKQVTLTCKS
jgi:hypothetical protein